MDMSRYQNGTAIHRRPERQALIPFRMSIEEKQQLQAEAEAHGWTLQQLVEARVWGAPRPKRRTNGKPVPVQDENLGIAI